MESLFSIYTRERNELFEALDNLTEAIREEMASGQRPGPPFCYTAACSLLDRLEKSSGLKRSKEYPWK